jgi:hypothetical protein
MGFLENKVVIAKCPACQATTKVAMEPGRLSIRCPRCKRQVPLAFARNYTGQQEAAQSERVEENKPVKETVFSSDAAAKASVQAIKQPRRGQMAVTTEVHYPDHNRKFTRYAIWIGGGVIVCAILIMGYAIWHDAVTARHQEYLDNVRESVSTSRQAWDVLNRISDLSGGGESLRTYRDLKGKLDYLTNRRGHLAKPPDHYSPELTDLTAELQSQEQRLTGLEKELQCNDKPITPKIVPIEPVAPNLGQTMLGGPPKAPSEMPVHAIPKVTDTKTVLVVLPGVTANQVNDLFLKRFAALADDGKGKATPVWSGDLLTLEVQSVANPAAFATKIDFGKLIYLSLSDRSITMQLNQDRLTNTPGAARDPLTPILADLKQREKFSKLLPALNRLADVKPDHRQAEVTAILVTLINQVEVDLKVREQAMKQLPSWGGKDVVPLLEKWLEEPTPILRWAAMDSLVELRSTRSAPAIAKYWTKSEVERIARVLVTLGPEVETTVLPFLHNTSEILVRVEACRVLKEIGTVQSLKPLLDVINAKDQPPAVVSAAKEAMQAILTRDTAK